MTTDPDNDRYTNSVATGEDGWGEEQDANLNRLEREVPEDKTLANRPASDANQAPNWLFATDDDGGDGTLYRNKGTEWDPYSLSASTVQAARDGRVVPVAPGVGMDQAVDPADTTTPIQDAIDLIESVGQSAEGSIGAGMVQLPPGVIETPGGIAGLGYKTIRGWGIQSTVIRCTDSSTSLFALGGDGSNIKYSGITDVCLDGGDRAARSAGSAISSVDTSSNSTTITMTDLGMHVGDIYCRNWGGSDPVIEGALGFSNRIDYLRADNYDGGLYKGGGFDFSMGRINVNHDTFDTPVIYLDGSGGPVYIESLNIGGNVGRALLYDKNNARYASAHIGHINIEPDDAHAGQTLTSAPAPIELYGKPPCSIASISQDTKVTTDHTVALDGSINYAGTSNDGPGYNMIGPINYTDASSGANVSVISAPVAPSWFWGNDADVDRGGFAANACIPMGNLDYTV